MVRIAYVTNVRLPSERAHGHQIAQVCDALSLLGHSVEIFAPFRKNIVREDFWTYYGVSNKIKVHHLGTFDPIASVLPGVTKLWTLNTMLNRSLKQALAGQAFDLLYTRSPALLRVLVETGKPVVLELHQLPRFGRRAFARRCNRCALVACLTSAMRDELKTWGVHASKMLVAGDAVDLRRFADVPSKEAARKKNNITTKRLVVGYVGRLKTLGMEKGVGTLLEALATLKSEKKFFGLIVGGPEGDRKEYEAKAMSLGLSTEDVRFTGEVDAKHVPEMLSACDILAMPFPDLPHYRSNMSPLKMFEYMAANRIIITSDLPTIRDVLSEETAVFVAPGNPQSLADRLQWITTHPEKALMRTQQAHQLVQSHTWEERMRNILNAAMLSRL